MEDEAGRWISQVSHQLKRQIFSGDLQDDLTNMQKHILHYILFETMHRDLFQKDVEKEYNIRRSTATETLQLLEKKGYIYRERVESDARLKRIVPTDKAVKVRCHLLDTIKRMEEQIKEGISENDMAVFLRVLKQISENLSS